MSNIGLNDVEFNVDPKDLSLEIPDFKTGDKIKFLKPSIFTSSEWGLDNKEYLNMLTYVNKKATIISEDLKGYYTIKFSDGYQLEAVSSYHFQKI